MQKFLFVGNHPCLDFINTQMIVKEEPADLLGGFEDLISWLLQARVLAKTQADVVRAELSHDQMSSLLEQAKSFRATLRGLAERLVASKPVPDSTIITINRFLSQRSGYPQLVRRKGGFEQRFHSAATPAQSVLAPLAEATSDLLCRANVALIKKCGNPSCILYFYDTTKNHTRNWCSMQLCGNRLKVAAYYRRSRGKASL
ncbi:MAG: ABATE domain-containing protein [Nitrospira sp.]|nr:ABATE domain-containing protein [Nitrospira sp.]